MATAQQITENQLNQHPKRFSRENRSTTAPGAILPHESRREFQRLIEEYTAEFHPATEHQRYLVWQLADARFRIARMNRFEQCLWDIIDDKRKCPTEDHRIVHNMMERGGNIYDQLHRYRCAAERAYNKAIKELASFCKTTETERVAPPDASGAANANIGFVLQNARKPLQIPNQQLKTDGPRQRRDQSEQRLPDASEG